MGQKDLRQKLLEDYEDVFSDIFNGLLFGENDIVNIGLHFFLKNVRPYAASCSEA